MVSRFAHVSIGPYGILGDSGSGNAYRMVSRLVFGSYGIYILCARCCRERPASPAT